VSQKVSETNSGDMNPNVEVGKEENVEFKSGDAVTFDDLEAVMESNAPEAKPAKEKGDKSQKEQEESHKKSQQTSEPHPSQKQETGDNKVRMEIVRKKTGNQKRKTSGR